MQEKKQNKKTTFLIFFVTLFLKGSSFEVNWLASEHTIISLDKGEVISEVTR